MAYKMNLTGEELSAGIKVLSSPEAKAGWSSLTFDSVKDNFINVLKNKYWCFEGTTDRKTFWQYMLVAVILAVIPVIGWLASICILPATLGITARRLHDIGKSGWLQVICVIPFIGYIFWVILMILCLLPANNGEGCGCGCGCEKK